MASTSHRRCQYQGDGCMGTAHAGHDQCAHCYFQHIKPALQAERAEVKRRRALKRMNATAKREPTLSRENRALISEVDLKEPQMRPETTEPISLNRAITEAIVDREVNQQIDQALKEDKDPYDAIGDMLLKQMLANTPSTPQAVFKAPRAPKEEPTPDMPAVKAPQAPVETKHRGRQSPLTAEQRDEILDAFKAGLPTAEIQVTYGIGAQTLYTMVRRAGIPLRGRPGRLPQENEVPTSTPPVSAPAPAAPTPNGVAADLTEWVVTYTVTRTESEKVYAKTFSQAAAAVEAKGASFEVVSVAKVNH